MSDIPVTPEGSPGEDADLPDDVVNQGGKPEPGQSPLAPNTDSRLSSLESTTADSLLRITNLENTT